MSAGTGIFLAGLAIAFAILLVARRHVPWKGILFSIGVIVATMLVIGLSVYGYDQYSNRPRPVHEYIGVALGDTIDEVRFKLGEPAKSTENAGTTELIYGDDHVSRHVRIRGGEVVLVLACLDNVLGSLPRLSRISKYSDLKSILERFGEPSNISKSGNSTARLYNFQKYNLTFLLDTASKLSCMGIFEGTPPAFTSAAN